MNPYDNNPFATDKFRDARSEFVANVQLARTVEKDKERKAMNKADALRDDILASELATRNEFYHMGVRHGLTRARNMFSQIMGD